LDGRITIENDGPVARLVIDRVSKRNALSLAMWNAIPVALRKIQADATTQAIVVEGSGVEAFAAGADIEELETLVENRQAGLATIDAIHAAEAALSSMDRPTVALVRGACIGGGLELAMACDIRLATSDSRFMAPPARLGIAYSVSSTRRLVELVGEGRAIEMLFAPKELSAEEALRSGLVTAVFDRAQFEEASQRYIDQLLRSSLFSIKSAKAIMGAVRRGHLEDPAEIRELRVQGFAGPDFAEGVAAFRTRRRPAFPWGRSQGN